jgi:hypothetical protein
MEKRIVPNKRAVLYFLTTPGRRNKKGGPKNKKVKRIYLKGMGNLIPNPPVCPMMNVTENNIPQIKPIVAYEKKGCFAIIFVFSDLTIISEQHEYYLFHKRMARFLPPVCCVADAISKFEINKNADQSN